MYVTREEVKVYTPEKGNALKITKDGKVIMYMKTPYYEIPGYDYEVEEIKESEIPVYKTNIGFKEFVERMKKLNKTNK